MKLFPMVELTKLNRIASFLCCLAFILICNGPATALGQSEADGLVATGTAKSEAMADRMRMTMTIEAKGADMEKAIETLKKRRKNAKIKMEKLGVIEDSIEFGSISTGSSDSGRQTQVRQAMMNQARGDKRLERMMKVAPPATVQVSVKADWKLDSELDDTQMLISVDQLKKKIVAVDIGSASEKDELSPAQEELAEEMAEMASRYSNDEKPSGPEFSFVRKVSSEDVKKLLADAVADAKKQAQELADSTGVKLGKIYRVARTDNTNKAAGYYDPYGGYRTKSTSKSVTNDDGSVHVVSNSPNVKVTRSVAFAFKIDAE